MSSLFLVPLAAVVGLVVGAIAYRITHRGSIWITLLLGSVGALLGDIGILAVGLGDFPEMISSVVGALVLLCPYLLLKRAKVSSESQSSSRQTTISEHQESTFPLQPTETRAAGSPKEIGRPVSRVSGGDIFISYAAPDRPTAQTLAKALHDEGWSVWWDRSIPPGKSFDEVIEAALDGAKCVIVLWSQASVTSNWVKVEAAEAARRRILVPALIAEVTIPLEFRRIQAASLVDWPTSAPHLGFQSLVGSVADLLGRPRESAR